MARAPLGRQQLLTAARAELLAGHGTLDLASVTRRAGVTSGALYHHFGSKAGLVTAIYTSFYDGLDTLLSDEGLPDESDWSARERERTRRIVDYHFADPLAEIFLNRAAPDPQIAEVEPLLIQRVSDATARNIRRGQQLGQLDADIDPDSAGAYIIGGLRHALAQQLRTVPRVSTETATALLWRYVAATLGLPAPQQGQS
ncbi:TetR/AcrR family transcriptional regulator [Nocardia sp. NPDC050710]|uniref:TetR/AcrR family transcriptional regulator n=1 Tax=Nocardia sp. NPDC050710 TaxID=3157220 RepID=UPI0033E1A0B6